jgi:hypothetical protein
MRSSSGTGLVYGSIISLSPRESDLDFLFSDGFVDANLYTRQQSNKPYKHFMRNLFLV